MPQLWAPWRMDYILSDRKKKACIFCAHRSSDAESLILYRTPFSLIMLNRYPYAYAHLMIAPVRHVQEVAKLTEEEMKDILQNLGMAIKVLKKAFRPSGFNVGMNLGKVSGAGIIHHLHFHLVPRWQGDINFMPLLAEVRIIPEHLQRTYEKLRVYFTKRKA